MRVMSFKIVSGRLGRCVGITILRIKTPYDASFAKLINKLLESLNALDQFGHIRFKILFLIVVKCELDIASNSPLFQLSEMWQVQYAINDDDSRVSVTMNDISLIDSTDKKVNGRFTLYPTENMYTFLLLNTIDGRVWQASVP